MKLSLKEDVGSLSFFKSNFTKVLQQTRDTHRPMVITQNGRTAGVFMDIETWERQMRKTKLLELVNEGERSLKEHGAIPLEDVESYFRKKYAL